MIDTRANAAFAALLLAAHEACEVIHSLCQRAELAEMARDQLQGELAALQAQARACN